MKDLSKWRKHARLFANIVGAFLSRSINLLSSLALVPLATTAMSTRDYGIFAVFLSAATFFTYADFGLGLAVVNRVASATTDRGFAEARRAISSVFAFLTFSAIVLTVFGALSLYWISDQAPGMTQWEFLTLGMIAFVCGTGAIPPSLAQRVFFALQRNVAGNLWLTAGRIGATIGCAFANLGHAGLAGFLSAMLGIPMVLTWASALHLFLSRPDLRPSFKLFSAQELKRDAYVGLQFSVLQLAVFAETGLDRILVGYFLSAEEVAHFDVTARLFSYVPALLSIASFPLWPALRNAIAEGDLAWAQRLRWASYVLGPLIAAAASTTLFLFHSPLIKSWTGLSATKDTASLALALAVFGVFSSLGTIQSMAANAQSLILSQAVIQCFFLLALVALKTAAIKYYGVTEMIWMMNILYVPRLLALERYVWSAYSSRPAVC